METFIANILVKVKVTSVDTMKSNLGGSRAILRIERFSQTSACLMFTLGSRDIMTNKERKKIRNINKEMFILCRDRETETVREK
jgi:hypothetical protein